MCAEEMDDATLPLDVEQAAAPRAHGGLGGAAGDEQQDTEEDAQLMTRAEGAAAPHEDSSDRAAARRSAAAAQSRHLAWAPYSGSVESVLVAAIMFLLASGIGGLDWVSGATSGEGTIVHSGLWQVQFGDGTLHSLDALCRASGDGSKAMLSVACALHHAGAASSQLAYLCLLIGGTLATCLALEALAARGALAEARGSLTARVPAPLLACLDAMYGALPDACWLLLSACSFGTLITFALRAPVSLGAGPAVVGLSFGCVRLAMLFAVCGLATHLSLVRGARCDVVFNGLDAGCRTWNQAGLRPKLSLFVMSAALVLELLMWLLRLEWGAFLMLYGLWSFTHRLHDHIACFCSVSIHHEPPTRCVSALLRHASFSRTGGSVFHVQQRTVFGLERRSVGCRRC